MNKENEEKHRKDKVKRKNLKNYNEHDFNEWLSNIEEWDNCRQEKRKKIMERIRKQLAI